MAHVVRRTISELGALYSLEPTLRDVFVEGADDCAFIKWYLKNRVKRLVSVVEIETIDVPASVVERYELDNGNRGRLLALSFEVSALLDPESRNCFTAVYDQDRDSIAGGTNAPDNALPTDFSCLEMYFFNTHTVGKFVALVLMNPDLTPTQAINALAPVLVRLWVIKAANHLLQYRMTWVSFRNLCSIDGNTIRFNETEFVRRYLMANGRLAHTEPFLAKIEEIDLMLSSDPRYHVDGHHFYVLAQWYFRHHASEDAAVRNQRAFERALTGCVELRTLDDSKLFQDILSRVA